jgi:uncharacterized membrane protein YeaQ/YmgE (transglycosylase-associated protein family)
MTSVGALVLLGIAAVCGVVGSLIAGFSVRGCIVCIILGFAGAWVGAWFAAQVHLPTLYLLQVHGESFAVVWSLLGATIFAGMASALTGRSRYEF